MKTLAGGRYEYGTCSVGSGAENEDQVEVRGSSFAVADGIGGVRYGSAYARLACSTALSVATTDGSAVDAVSHASVKAKAFSSDCLIERGGAALLVGSIAGDTLDLAWEGDVRAYAFDDQRGLVPLNEPDRSGTKLTKSVGTKYFVPNEAQIDLSDAPRLLICTDGVWDHLDQQEMTSIMRESQSAAEASARLVLGRELHDDATALVLFPTR